MRRSIISSCLYYIYASQLLIIPSSATPLSQAPLTGSLLSSASHNISAELFTDLEELSRIVDISYCVGTTGIQKPFLCASRCTDFQGFELVTVGSHVRFLIQKEDATLIYYYLRRGRLAHYLQIAAATLRLTMPRPAPASSLPFEAPLPWRTL